MKNKHWYISFLIILIFPYLILAEEDSVSFVSYYPSAYGVYRQLKLHPVTDMTAADCYEANEGAMFYDKNTNEAKVCRKEGINNYTWQAFQTQAGGGFTNFQIYDLPNTYQWLAPVGVTKIMVEVWGAGGSGGGNGSNVNACRAAGGGGGGGYGKAIINVNPGDLYSLKVGAGGAAIISAGVNGNDGDDSYFTNLIVVVGGKGGQTSSVSDIPVGGAGGTVSGTASAIISVNGMSGEGGVNTFQTSGHGYGGKGGDLGGGGGTGGYGAYFYGVGGITQFAVAQSGQVPGGGGGGASGHATDASGAGAPGRVIIWY